MGYFNAVGSSILTLHNFLVCTAAALLVAAAAQDVVARTVSNSSTIVLGSVGVVMRLLDGTAILAGCIAVIVFCIALGCWARGWIGGGDVKLLGAAMLLVTPPLQISVLILMSLAGGIISAVFLVTRQWLTVRKVPKPPGFLRRAVRIELWRMERGGPIPYAVAIAVGALGVMASEGLAQ